MQPPKEAEGARPKWETAQTLEDYWDARRTFFTEEQRAKAWKETADILKTYSDEMVARWNQEIDTLLVYAGLFSAILTAFNVQSYQLLTPPPEVDPVIIALERISAQLSSFAVNLPSVNSTQPAFVQYDPIPPRATRWAVWLNALWFSSLIFSLSAASIGIMVKQWLNEYSTGISGTSRQNARLRQLRLNSLRRWRVKEIVSLLPVLLQIASGLFFAGLLILLWNLNRTVATVGTVLVGILAIFSLLTIVLPSIATHCSYLSPPSRALFQLTRPLRKLTNVCRCQLSSWILGRYGISIWQLQARLDLKDFQREHPRTFGFCYLLCPQNVPVALRWRGMELSLLSQLSDKLDGDMVATAYATSMDIGYLDHAAVCTTELSLDITRQCFQAIQAASTAHWGTIELQLQMWSVHPCMWSGSLISLMNVSVNDAAWSPSALATALNTAYESINELSQNIQSDVPRTRLLCADFVRIIRHFSHSTLPPGAMDVKEGIHDDYLPRVMEQTRGINLGKDIRQYGQFALKLSLRCPPLN
ncbi:hypothetical protein OH76DRAFT_1008238 [Lentinus brumalis]|uniref:DUF6535 domain-containing protein n=1 Tax=Lentinus brumalis TaxID=2498619 RepID=A0A371CYB5_9APHY|nr:hypothetical protein OH76DRAFT_1008238 [Polyporus brumalis]